MHLEPHPQVDVIENWTLVSDMKEQVHILRTILHLLEGLQLGQDHALKQDKNERVCNKGAVFKGLPSAIAPPP